HTRLQGDWSSDVCSSDLGAAVGSTLLAAEPNLRSSGETIYNGIRLVSPWPPQTTALSREPMKLPYLDSPPAIIPTDIGRQLFVRSEERRVGKEGSYWR